MRLSRRQFLKRGAAAGTAATVAPVLLSPKRAAAAYSSLNKWPGRVVLNYNNLQNASETGGDPSDEAILKAMVDDAILLLTGESTVGEAWASIFPTLTQSTTIAIKVNILNAGLPPHPLLVKAMVEGLVQMDAGGSSFPASNIYIYDGNNGSSFDSAGFSETRFPGVNRVHYGDNPAYSSNSGSVRGLPYSQTLHDRDYLINVPGLRGHGSDYGSATLGFKSHYGTYNPGHSGPAEYLRDINATGPVYDKTVLTFLGAIYGLRLGHGPGGSWDVPDYYTGYAQIMDPTTSDPRPNTLVIGTDPVSVEYHAYKIMRQRVDPPQDFSVDSMPSYLKACAGIDGSLGTVYNIGIIDPNQMEYGEIINGTTTSGFGPDTTAPTVSSVSCSIEPTEVNVVFSESVEQSSAENTANYTVNNGINVTGASLGSDNRTVTLTVDALTEGTAYNVTIRNVRDRAASPNTMVESNHDFTYSATGVIVREYWNGVAGTAVSDLTGDPNYPDNPTGTELMTSLEAGSATGDDYGARIRGYIHPAETGTYRFWVASDDASELWLSTDATEGNKQLIASVDSWTDSRAWTTYPSQASSGIQLEAGSKYYIEVLHKEGSGGDNVAAAWQPPSGSSPGVIDGQFLSPFIDGNTERGAWPHSRTDYGLFEVRNGLSGKSVITVKGNGVHKVDVMTLNGAVAQRYRGSGRREYALQTTNRPRTLYAIRVEVDGKRATKVVSVPRR